MRSRRTTLLMWDDLSDLSTDVQEDVSDCVYAMAYASDSPVRGLNPSRKSLVAEMNSRAAGILRRMSGMIRGTVVRTLIVTGVEYVGGRMKLSMQIGVSEGVRDLTIIV